MNYDGATILTYSFSIFIGYCGRTTRLILAKIYFLLSPSERREAEARGKGTNPPPPRYLHPGKRKH